MAYTVTKLQGAEGNKRVVYMDVSADAAEANLQTGLSYIDGFTIGSQSMATSAWSILPNVTSTGTAANGTLGISGLASGDDFFIKVYGRS